MISGGSVPFVVTTVVVAEVDVDDGDGVDEIIVVGCNVEMVDGSSVADCVGDSDEAFSVDMADNRVVDSSFV